MDTLHTVLRALRADESKNKKHLTVFREFLSHLDQASRRAPVPKRLPKKAKPVARRGRR